MVGCDEDRPFVWIVRRYCNCQFQVTPEAAFIVKVTVLTGDVTDSVIDVVALNHPLDGVGLPWEEVTVRKYW